VTGHHFAKIRRIHGPAYADLFYISDAGDSQRPCLCRRQGRQQQRRQNGDDGNDHQKLNQRKSAQEGAFVFGLLRAGTPVAEFVHFVHDPDLAISNLFYRQSGQRHKRCMTPFIIPTVNWHVNFCINLTSLPGEGKILFWVGFAKLFEKSALCPPQIDADPGVKNPPIRLISLICRWI
jgi:hypothetical protein